MTYAIGRTAQSRSAKLDEILRHSPIIPVITIERVEDAVPLARALLAGGLAALEITLRTKAAPAAAAAIAKAVPEAIVGLGTVLTCEDLETARSLGARFALSPGPASARCGRSGRSPVHSRSSDAIRDHGRSCSRLRYRQVLPGGGRRHRRSKALAGPFPQMRYCPTGGVGEDNFAPSGWLGPSRLRRWLVAGADVDIRAGDWETITERARRAMDKVGAGKPG